MIDTGWTARPVTTVVAVTPVTTAQHTNLAHIQRVQPAGSVTAALAAPERRTAAPLPFQEPDDHVAPPSALQLQITSWLDQQVADLVQKDAAPSPDPDETRLPSHADAASNSPSTVSQQTDEPAP